MPESLRSTFPNACYNCPSAPDSVFDAAREDLRMSESISLVVEAARQSIDDPETIATVQGLAHEYRQKAEERLPSCRTGIWVARSEAMPGTSVAACGKMAGVVILNTTADYPPVTVSRPEF